MLYVGPALTTPKRRKVFLVVNAVLLGFYAAALLSFIIFIT